MMEAGVNACSVIPFLSHLKLCEGNNFHQRTVTCLWLCYKTVYSSTIPDLVYNKSQNHLGQVQSHPICSPTYGTALLR